MCCKKQMEKKSENRITLTWNFTNMGLFQATIWDGKLYRAEFCHYGCSPELVITDTPSDLKYLKAIHQATGDLLRELGQGTDFA